MSTLQAEIDSIPKKLISSQELATEAISKACSDWHSGTPVRMLMTIARGTSDAAATFVAHEFARLANIPVGSFTPSLASLGNFQLEDATIKALAISQSGKSPDIIAALNAFTKQSRWALTNVDNSELENIANIRLPIGAGVEQSVAATKTFACSLLHIHFLACKIAKQTTPDIQVLADAAAHGLANPIKLDAFSNATSAFVIGRGTTLCLAQEAAIKIKELSGLHAEAYSAAEVMHGPKALAGPNLPILAFPSPDEIGKTVHEAAEVLAKLNSPVIMYIPKSTDSVAALFESLTAFYQAIPKLATQRGFDPNNPVAITKVTQTT